MSDSLTLAQAAEFLKIHPDTCARLTKARKIPGCKIGRAWVYHRALLDGAPRCLAATVHKSNYAPIRGLA
jgi:excisionase family DNA binding protein